MYYSWLVGYRVDQTESCQACFHPRGVTPNLGKTQFSAVEGFPLSPHLHQCLRILESWLDEAEVFSNHDSDIFWSCSHVEPETYHAYAYKRS